VEVFQVFLYAFYVVVLTLRRVVGTQRIVVALLLTGCAVRVRGTGRWLVVFRHDGSPQRVYTGLEKPPCAIVQLVCPSVR
jgi:hypothetical protein